MKRELRLAIVISFCMWLLFVLPLKSVCKLSLEGLPVRYEISITILLLLSGLIAYIVAKVNQNIKGNANNINIPEFVYIMTLSMATTSFFILFGCPLLGLFLSGGIGIVTLGLEGIFKALFSQFQPPVICMVVGGEGGVPNTEGASTEQAEGSRGGSKIDPATMAFVNNKLREELALLDGNFTKMTKILKDFNTLPLTLEIKEAQVHF